MKKFYSIENLANDLIYCSETTNIIITHNLLLGSLILDDIRKKYFILLDEFNSQYNLCYKPRIIKDNKHQLFFESNRIHVISNRNHAIGWSATSIYIHINVLNNIDKILKIYSTILPSIRSVEDIKFLLF